MKLENGEGDKREIPMLEEISRLLVHSLHSYTYTYIHTCFYRGIEGHTICALGDAAAWPVQVRVSYT